MYQTVFRLRHDECLVRAAPAMNMPLLQFFSWKPVADTMLGISAWYTAFDSMNTGRCKAVHACCMHVLGIEIRFHTRLACGEEDSVQSDGV